MSSIKDKTGQHPNPFVRSFVRKIVQTVGWWWYSLSTGGLYLLPNGELYRLGG